MKTLSSMAVLKCGGLLLLTLLGISMATPGHHHHHYHTYKPVDYYAVPKYHYSYGVNDHHTGDVKSAYETRDGSVTKGSYSVLQPDGIMRVVTYTADPLHGFRAVVTNKGYAHHPTAIVHKPVVKAVVIKKPVVKIHHHYGHDHDHDHHHHHDHADHVDHDGYH